MKVNVAVSLAFSSVMSVASWLEMGQHRHTKVRSLVCTLRYLVEHVILQPYYSPRLGLEGQVGQLGGNDVELVRVEGDGGGGLVDVEVDQNMAVKCEVDQVGGQCEVIVGGSDISGEDDASSSCMGVHLFLFNWWWGWR